MHRALAAAATAAVGISVLAATAASASQPSANKPAADKPAATLAAKSAANPPRVSQSGHIRTGSVSRFNVGATHSPALERLLASHTAVATRASTVRPASLPAAASTLQGIDVASFQHPGGA